MTAQTQATQAQNTVTLMRNMVNKVLPYRDWEKQQKENDDKAYRERIIDGQKIDQILSELSELKQIINVHINQDKLEKEHLRDEIGDIKREIDELIRQNNPHVR